MFLGNWKKCLKTRFELVDRHFLPPKKKRRKHRFLSESFFQKNGSFWDPSFVAATCVSSRRHFVDYRTTQKVWRICLWKFVVPTFMGNACSGKVVLFFMVTHAHVMNTEKRPSNSASWDGGGGGQKT